MYYVALKTDFRSKILFIPTDFDLPGNSNETTFEF